MNKPILSQELTEKQSLNLFQQQSLKILSMPMEELKDYVLKELNENPFLEEDETVRIENENSFFGSGALSENYQNSINSDDGLTTLLDYSSEKTFVEYLQEQSNETVSSKREKELVEYLIHSLDEKGYLTVPISEISVECHATPTEVRHALQILRSFSPAGVGAFTLQECLLLQLKQMKGDTSCEAKIVENYLMLLAQNKIQKIAEKTGFSISETKKACTTIRNLKPIPSSGFHSGRSSIMVVPDIKVRYEDGTFVIRINKGFIPNIRINQSYRTLSQKGMSPAERDYFKSHISRADHLIWEIEKRNITLERIAKELVLYQSEFFRSGGQLHPYTITKLSETTGIGISTVSRAVRDKYIDTIAGIISMRSLFDAGYQKDNSETLSAGEIRKRIRMLIERETSSDPISDEKIRKALLKEGIAISRRTVTKYRERMGIPSSTYRRR